MDQALLSYVRARLAQARPATGGRQIDAFLSSPAFSGLLPTFGARLAREFDRFLADALPPPPQPELPDLALRLPNARAGERYTQRIEVLGKAEALVFEALALPAGLILEADLATGTLSGTPPQAGAFTIVVDYRYAGHPGGRQRRALVQLLVLPDPRTMWQDRPSDRKDPYWKPDAQCDSVRGAGLATLAASKRGRAHAHAGGFRDDDFRIAHVAASGWHLAVVADGAGSARYARRGAALICEQAHARILAALGGSAAARLDASVHALAQARQDPPAGREDALHEALRTDLSHIVGNAAYYAVRAILEEVAAHPDPDAQFRDYASTALIAVGKRYPFGTLCAAYWVGDGAVAIYSRRGGVTLLGAADSGEYAGQTRFLDNAAISHAMLRQRTQVALVEDMTALVLMTDGVSDARFETEARLGRSADWHLFWEELERTAGVGVPGPWSGNEGARRLLDWLDFWSPGNHDDRTIAIVHHVDQD
ncbi:protein phosphatase 2C domain-containing protein [Massilia oculi]|uniref:Protein phosphatase 2C domain-containing protein n=1 Tax=Massilia hydrophila TaxID=3044279 RepID=A0ABS7Y9D1_9BURK|nr:protein phosphatase 2C domain-containing protein [Massilia oculi]MCA1855592.1 protein phosphatase 2C domain-containing protein [Massilia oculi]